MSYLVQRLLGRERKAIERVNQSALVTPGQARWSARDYATYAEEGYGGNPYIYSAVSLIARSAGGIRVQVGTRVDDDGTIEQFPQTHWASKLCRRLNRWASWSRYVEDMLSYYLIGGECFGIGVGSSFSPLVEVWPVRPDQIRPVPGSALGEVLRFERDEANGRKTNIEPDDVFWIRAFDPLNDYQGQPPAAAAAHAVDTSNSAFEFNNKLMQNGSSNLFFRAAGQQPTNDEQSRFEEIFSQRYGGKSNAGKAMLIGGIDSIEKVGLVPNEMQLDQMMAVYIRAIAISHRLAPEVLGDATSKNYANFREARAGLYTECVLPLLDAFLEEFSAWLTLRARLARNPEDIAVTYNRDDIEALSEQASDVWTRADAAQELMVNEKRQLKGYDPVPGGDVILVPAGMAPLEAVTGAADITETVDDGTDESE